MTEVPAIYLWNRNPHLSQTLRPRNNPQAKNLTIVYSIVYLDTDQRKHQSS